MILFEERAATVLYKVLSNIKNKKFLLPLNVCPIVPDTFFKANKEFEFIDINLKTLCIDEDLILQKIANDKTIDGVLFVKTFGITLDNSKLYSKIKAMNTNIFIIDDMCPSIQEFDYQINDSDVDLALFSSGYSKYIDIGYGGYGFVKNSDFYKIFQDKYPTKEFQEYKQKILTLIPKMKEHKKSLNAIYKKNIDKKYWLGEDFNNWRFSILVDNKEEILEAIFKQKNLFASSHYPQIDYNYVQEAQKNTNTDKVHSKILNLFNDFRYDAIKAQQTADIINQYL
jgi:dTDP-4-amino-4,6-dideoxygalactose transaminase